MKLFVFILVLISVSPMSELDFSNKRVDKEIKNSFNLDSYAPKLIELDTTLKSELKADFWNNNFFKIENEESIVGYAYLGQGFGKTDNFEYLLLFDKDLIIIKSKVLKYREDYGGEIASKRWLKQFIGKSSKDKLLYGTNIAAISGATLSVRSMTNSVNKVLESLAILQKKNIL